MKKQEGASLVELLCVLAIMLILMAFAVPATGPWRDNARQRSAARELVSTMRESRMRSIKSNLEHRVEFDIGRNSYRLSHGNRASNSTASSWNNNIIRDWQPLPATAQLRANADCSVVQGKVSLHFNPSGSSSTRYICILDQNGTPRFRVGIPRAATGRAVIQQWQGRWQ